MTSPFRLGLDLGSTAAKAVLLAPDNTLLGFALDDGGRPPDALAAELAARLLAEHGVTQSDAVATVATGYGRSLAGSAERTITEITCHARGVRWLHPDAATILDIGGQDAKAILLDEDGSVRDFAMNDRCAAGTGRFLEVAARRYGLAVGELSAFCGDTADAGAGADVGADVDDAAPQLEISSTCVVFAESELVNFNARGVPPVAALRAVHRAIARRVALLLGQVKARPPLYFTGGVAANAALRAALAAECALEVRPTNHAQFTGALGAALSA